MEGREPMAGIISPPHPFSLILQKGLAAHLGGSSPSIPAPPSGLHAPTPMRPTSAMAAHTTGQPPYEAGSGIQDVQPIPASMHMGSKTGAMEAVKKKRGRPRKYAPDGSMALSLVSHSTAAASGPATPSKKQGQGRPHGLGRKQQLAALGTAGAGFTPHVITVAAGEDVAMKVMSFSQKGPRAVCILSANGAISNVTLRQSATSGGTVTYEGRFEILSLSGSFLPTENASISSRTGGLSVSLAGPDGQVLGGGVAGLLMAASPVQVVVGSFLSSVKKSQLKAANAKGLANLSQDVNTNAATPLVRPLMHETVVANAESPSTTSANAHQTHSHNSMFTSFHSTPWPVSDAMPDVRRNTDVNILPCG